MNVWTPWNKHTVKVCHRGLGPHPDDSEGVSDAQASRMPDYNPLLAYPLECIDPTLDSQRDEGEARMRLLRNVLFMAKRNAPGLVDVDSDASFVAKIVTPTQRVEAHMSLFKADAAWTPRICLHAPTTKTFGATTADTVAEGMRVECIPVKGTEMVAALDWPKERLPAPKLLLEFDKKHVGQNGAYVQLKRSLHEATEMDAVIFTPSGSRDALKLSGIDARMLERLFSPIGDEHSVQPLPELPGELPTDVMSAVADFWQEHMRCHVITAACAPDGATRPLAFESIKVGREGRSAPERLVLRAKLHPSAIKCACRMHGLSPMEERFPSEKFEPIAEVDLTLSMCGRKRPRTESGYGPCPLHQGATPDVKLLPGICCQGTVASLGCSHLLRGKQKQKRSRRRGGLWVPDMGLEGSNELHAQALLASASAVAAKLEPMLGKRSREEIRIVCEAAERATDRVVAEVDRHRAAHDTARSDAQYAKLDQAAVDALRSCKYRRHVRPTTKDEVLARCNEDDKWVPVTKAEADKGKAPPLELVATHLGLFAPPLPRARRA